MIHVQLARLAFVGTHTARDIDRMFANHAAVEQALTEAEQLATVLETAHTDRIARRMRRIAA